MASAVGYMHKQNIVHRDIKVTNCTIVDCDACCITIFGYTAYCYTGYTAKLIDNVLQWKPFLCSTTREALSLNCEESLKNSSIQIWSWTKISSICPRHTPNLSTKFRPNQFMPFWDIVLTDKQTDRQGWKRNHSLSECVFNFHIYLHIYIVKMLLHIFSLQVCQFLRCWFASYWFIRSSGATLLVFSKFAFLKNNSLTHAPFPDCQPYLDYYFRKGRTLHSSWNCLQIGLEIDKGLHL